MGVSVEYVETPAGVVGRCSRCGIPAEVSQSGSVLEMSSHGPLAPSAVHTEEHCLAQTTGISVSGLRGATTQRIQR